ncbi:hypothetical protein K1719_046026 [Acacia pycnantha]|nr:hypothetical protein K1719_046026 [Acacia pycnantha]
MSLIQAVAIMAALLLWDAISLSHNTCASIAEEEHALLQSKWWINNTMGVSYNMTDHCKWNGIVCNDFGSIIEIEAPHIITTSQQPQLRDLNFTAFPNLKSLSLIGLRLMGTIPTQIGALRNLRFLNLANNNLIGELPSTLTNLTRLELLDLTGNKLSGVIPSTLGVLTSLQSLCLSSNLLTGEIPSAILNLTKLTMLELFQNHISGSIPEQIEKLTDLTILDLSHNNICGSIPMSLNLTRLEKLHVSNNFVSGELPCSLSKLKSLSSLQLQVNEIYGSIPSCVAQMTNLTRIDLFDNKFSGQLPITLQNLTQLRSLDLSGNMIGGTIPSSLGSITALSYLNLSSNMFTGEIPSSISKLTERSVKNNIYGNIPEEIGHLPNLHTLELYQNKLIGNMSTFYLQSYLVGNFSHNNINGELLPRLCLYPESCRIDLSYNNITGSIPKELSKMQYINLSYNFLSGYVPSDVYSSFPHDIFKGNNELHCPEEICYSSKSPKSSLKIILPLTIILATIFIVGLILFQSFRKSKKPKIERRVVKNGDLFSIWNFDGKNAYEDIIKATEDFDIKYCIEIGAYGSVYKAQLPGGRIVAVKKLHMRESEEPSFNRSFKNESTNVD